MPSYHIITQIMKWHAMLFMYVFWHVTFALITENEEIPITTDSRFDMNTFDYSIHTKPLLTTLQLRAISIKMSYSKAQNT